MGLSIHIQTQAPASLGGDEMAAVVSRWHDIARAFAIRGAIDEVSEISGKEVDLEQFATAWVSIPHPSEPDTVTAIAVRPLEGTVFVVSPGKGCEPLTLGLCRYPMAVKSATGGDLPTEKSGWSLLSSCKTQYASALGWEAFRRCHVAVVELAAAGVSLGIDIRIDDEGGYWPARNEPRLRATLEQLNRLAAGLAGALKDVADADGAGDAPSVQASIFAHPDFERLEAEAHGTNDAQKLDEALRILRGYKR